MNNNFIYFVIFNLNKYDPVFAFSFHKLNKYAKNTCEYSLTKIVRFKLQCVKLNKFKYLKILNLLDTYRKDIDFNHVYELKHLKYLNSTGFICNFKRFNSLISIKCSNDIKDEEICHLNIKKIYIYNKIYNCLSKKNLYAVLFSFDMNINNMINYNYLYSFSISYIFETCNLNYSHMFLNTLILKGVNLDINLLNNYSIHKLFLSYEIDYDYNKIKLFNNLHTLQVSLLNYEDYLKLKIHTLYLPFNKKHFVKHMLKDICVIY